MVRYPAVEGGNAGRHLANCLSPLQPAHPHQTKAVLREVLSGGVHGRVARHFAPFPEVPRAAHQLELGLGSEAAAPHARVEVAAQVTGRVGGRGAGGIDGRRRGRTELFDIPILTMLRLKIMIM